QGGLQMRQKTRQTAFAKWMGAILDALRDLGGSGSPREVIDRIIVARGISDDQLGERLASGGPRFHNQVYWARQYLTWEGILESTRKGTWILSERGEHTHLSE